VYFTSMSMGYAIMTELPPDTLRDQRHDHRPDL
jgi:hypothetical protein